MYLASIKPGRYIRTHLLSALGVSLLATSIASPARAQVSNDTGARGSNTIEGQLYGPGGGHFNGQARVRINGARTAEQVTTTNWNGSFSFHDLPGGTYYITVDAGEEYEQAGERVDLVGKESAVTVHITLQPKRRRKQVTGTIDASVADAPEAALKLYRAALASAEAGNREKAIEQLKGALSIHPDFMLAHNEIGVQYIKLRKPDKAAEELRSALRLAPEAFAPHLNYGIALLQMKDYAGAAAEFEQAIKKDGASVAARLYYGQALIRLNRYDESEKQLQKAINLGGTESVEAHRYLAAVHIEMNESERAASELETYLKLAPKAKDASKIGEIIKQLRSQSVANRK